MKKITFYTLLLIFTLWNCTDALEEQPNNEVFIDSVEEFELFLNNFNYFRYNPAQQLLMSDSYYWSPETVTCISNQDSRNSQGLNAYLWEDNTYEDGNEAWDWTEPYKSIYRTNYILEKIDDAPVSPGNEDKRAVVKATALSQRAWAFFVLVNSFAKHYNPATAANDPGVPFPLVTSDEIAPRASVKDIYDQIVQDCEAALPHLPDLPPFTGGLFSEFAPSKVGVNAFLSRVYLYMATDTGSESMAFLEKAKNAAAKSLAIYNFLEDLNISSYPAHSDNNEYVWRKVSPFASRKGYKGEDNPTECDPLVPQDLFDLYQTDDLRIAPLSFKYRTISSGKWSFLTTSSVGLLVGEVILNKAEAEARLGDLDAAANTVNQLREKRFKTGSNYKLDFTGVSQADAIQEIIDERRREGANSATRWFDQKRLILLGEYTRTIVREDTNGTQYTLAPGDIKYVREIPASIQEFNPGLTNR